MEKNERLELEFTNLDSNLYDVRKSMTSLLKSNGVQKVISKSNELNHDIKTFDQEIQALVCENYNRFIGAIDTVKKIKDNILKLDEKMKTLDQTMNKVNKVSLTIDSALKTKQKEIQKLDVINKDLQKLSNLCEFPKVLKTDLEHYQEQLKKKEEVDYSTLFQKSLDYYEKCAETLFKYQIETLVKPIYNDSIFNIEEMRSILWNLQNSRTIGKQHLKEVTKKLLILIDDSSSVLKNYLKIIKDRHSSELKKFVKENAKLVPKDDHSFSKEESEDKEIMKFFEEKHFDIKVDEFEDFKQKLELSFGKEAPKEGSCMWFTKLLSEQIVKDLHDEINYLVMVISSFYLCIFKKLDIAKGQEDPDERSKLPGNGGEDTIGNAGEFAEYNKGEFHNVQNQQFSVKLIAEIHIQHRYFENFE